MEQVEELEDRIQRLQALLEASKKLNSTHGIDQVLAEILQQMINVIEAEAGTLWLLNAEKSHIEAKAAEGPSSEKILHIKLQKDEGIVGKVIESGVSQLIEDVSKDPSWAQRVDEASGFKTVSMLTVPLVANGIALGALQLINKNGGNHFNEMDQSLAVSLANQSAIALQNNQMYNDMYLMSMSVIRTLTKAIDARDEYTAGHSERVAKYSVVIGESLGLSESKLEELERAALLHDIGKIGIPDHILSKAGKLTDYEYQIMKQHPTIGADILANMEPKSMMIHATEIANYHHERLNGTGYPSGLKGDEIPFNAQIVAVADSFDAMTTNRPYQKARSYKDGADELVRCRGSLYNEACVDTFINYLEEDGYKIDGKSQMDQLSLKKVW